MTRAEGLYRAVAVEPGVSTVALRYEPPGLRLGLFVLAMSTALLVVLCGPFTRKAAGAAPARAAS